MIQIALFSIGVFLILISWRCMWDPTMVDLTRDRLFDLRDITVKKYFVVNHTLNHEAYAGLRDILNKHLRLTESLSLPGFLFTIALLERRKIARQEIGALMDPRLMTEDKELRAFIDSTRERAATIILQHMVLTSVLSVTVSLILFPIFFFKYALKLTKISVDKLIKVSVRETAIAVGKMLIHKPQNTLEEAAISTGEWRDCHLH